MLLRERLPVVFWVWCWSAVADWLVAGAVRPPARGHDQPVWLVVEDLLCKPGRNRRARPGRASGDGGAHGDDDGGCGGD